MISQSVIWIPVFFLSATLAMYLLASNFPVETDSDLDSSQLKFPRSIDDLHQLANLLLGYKNDHYFYVLMLFVCAYLYKQTFAIPGSVFMNLLAGALYGRWLGFLLACLLTSCGATFCFLLSKYFGRKYIIKFFPQKVQYLQNMIEQNMGSLLYFLLFLRLFPMSPNWLMNMIAPIVNIPIHLFFLSVFIGLMPYNFICVQTGCFLSEITSLDDIFSLWTLITLCGIATAALLPGCLIQRYQTRRDKIK